MYLLTISFFILLNFYLFSIFSDIDVFIITSFFRSFNSIESTPQSTKDEETVGYGVGSPELKYQKKKDGEDVDVTKDGKEIEDGEDERDEMVTVFEDDDDTKDEESLDEYHEEDIDVEENVEVDDSEEFSHL
ncbi:histone H2A.Z-specific chaperone CHZ1-like [Lactuca sativa]|uniref:histone H2A.Z-specific chaperone CHZ1-like n=1 Tax=Lactuca sativa TaxID=4236 RepID=UPI0022AEDDD4|nr:histone H2A.Z-specific chaperone CHZ1-like [Lactuca sativa]